MEAWTRQNMDFFDEIISRNIENIYPSKEAFLKRLSSEKKLKIYLGIDPSSPRIHLGNAIPLRKLAEFQNLGHEIILLIGDFTGMIGDPTGKDTTRVPLTSEQVLENSKDYQKQASKILNFTGKNKAKIAYNSHWLSKINFAELIKLASHFTVQQMLERDMFQKRLKENNPISIHEFLYPIMQGYDSVNLDVDLEIGGTDQTFNMLVGRELQKKFNDKEKFVITLPLLEGTDGRKMSKSYGNTIDIDEKPFEMYRQVMAVEDKLIWRYFDLATNLSVEELKKLRNSEKDKNPLELKKKLARTIVSMYHDQDLAEKAEAEFEKVVQGGETPTEVEEFEFAKSILPKPYLYFLVETSMVKSNSEAARLASQGGIEFDGQKITDLKEDFNPEKSTVLIRAGKRKFSRVSFV